MALNKQQLMNLWVRAGGNPAAAGTAAAIALAESGGRVNALNPRAPDYSVGPWQINYYGRLGPERTRQFGSAQQLRSDPLANARAAVSISGGGRNFSPWSTYTSGAYKSYLGGGAVSAGHLRSMAAAPVGQPELAVGAHPYSDFARAMIASFGHTGPSSTEGLLGAIMQLRRSVTGGATLAVQPSMASAPGQATGLDDDFNTRLGQLEKAVPGLSVTSGYRSVAEQTKLFNAAVQKYGSVEAARKYVAPPGRSNHNRGLAADLSGNLELAHRLAPQYGLTFPMSWEPWHVEPIGIR